ncbi:MAG: serine aminopeptidase domain-containing protein, partial [Thermodesulfobacteriota bacterium]
VPALVVHTRRDPIADPEGSRRIFEKIGSRDKQYILFNYERHSLLFGEGAHRIHRAISDFIEDIQY